MKALFRTCKAWIVALATASALAVGCTGVTDIAVAQTPPADTPEVAKIKTEMTAAFTASDWDAFVEGFEALQKHDATIAPGLWFRLATVQMNREKYDEARQAYEQAGEAGFNPPFVALGLAGAAAADGDKDEAFAALGRAIDAGFNNVMILDSNPRLQSLHGDSRYQEVRERMEQAHPCSRPECRQFDFWVGEWDVHGPNGGKAGTNRIEPILNRCALLENWSGASGSGGKSVNFYHPGKKKWIQIWVDGFGGVIEIEGEYKDGAMRFTGRNTAANGNYELCRASWTLLEDGRVRQFWEQSRDDGATWYTWFDGYYSRSDTSSE